VIEESRLAVQVLGYIEKTEHPANLSMVDLFQAFPKVSKKKINVFVSDPHKIGLFERRNQRTSTDSKTVYIQTVIDGLTPQGKEYLEDARLDERERIKGIVLTWLGGVVTAFIVVVLGNCATEMLF